MILPGYLHDSIQQFGCVEDRKLRTFSVDLQVSNDLMALENVVQRDGVYRLWTQIGRRMTTVRTSAGKDRSSTRVQADGVGCKEQFSGWFVRAPNGKILH